MKSCPFFKDFRPDDFNDGFTERLLLTDSLQKIIQNM